MNKSNTALLIVDVQNELVEGSPYNIDTVLKNISILIDACHKAKIEVIYIQHTEIADDGFKADTHGWQIHESITPIEGEMTFMKSYNSAFKDTELRRYLDSKGIVNLIVVGMQTDYCIDSTVKVGFEYGYKLIIPEGTNTTFDNGYASAEQVVGMLNLGVYKGRFGEVVSVEEVVGKIT